MSSNFKVFNLYSSATQTREVPLMLNPFANFPIDEIFRFDGKKWVLRDNVLPTPAPAT